MSASGARRRLWVHHNGHDESPSGFASCGPSPALKPLASP